jgi:hypothetical protein
MYFQFAGLSPALPPTLYRLFTLRFPPRAFIWGQGAAEGTARAVYWVPQRIWIEAAYFTMVT